MRKNLLDYSLEELYDIDILTPSFRARQLYDLVSVGARWEDVTVLPKQMLEQLKSRFALGVTIKETFVSKDGSAKFLFALDDGNIVEGVFMPHDYGNTVCVSTQVGCRMGCAFCASGIGGLVRNLTAGEILGQVLAFNGFFAEKKGKRAVTNIVLMGSGEPLDNYDEVTKFLRLVSGERGINISQRNISLSTCGIVPKIRQLADDGFSVTLSVSLHATTDDARRQLMPIANKYSITEIIGAVKYYFQKTSRRIIFEYSMVKGSNIDFFDAKRLSELTKGYPSHVNLIMLNPVKEKNVKGCTKAEADRFLERLKNFGVSATIRRSFGADIGGACGQLRRSYVDVSSDKK